MRNDRLRLVALAEDVGWGVVDPDHVERNPGNPYALANGIAEPEELARQFRIDHHDPGAGFALQVREGSAGEDVATGDIEPPETASPDGTALRSTSKHDIRPGSLVDHDVGDRRQLPDAVRLSDGEWGLATPRAHLVRSVGHMDAGLEKTEHKERARPELVEDIGDAAVDAGDHRTDHHHYHHPDGDAEDGERGPDLVGPE